MKRKDYFFYYFDRYRSGLFDIREVMSWETEGQNYYLKYRLRFKDGSMRTLEPEEFRRFEEKFDQLEDKG